MIARNLKTTSVPLFALATTIAVRKALSHEVPWATCLTIAPLIGTT